MGSETLQPGDSKPGVVGAVEGTLDEAVDAPWEKYEELMLV